MCATLTAEVLCFCISGTMQAQDSNMINDIRNFNHRHNNINHNAYADSDDELEIPYSFDDETKIGTYEQCVADYENDSKFKIFVSIELDAGLLDSKSCISYLQKNAFAALKKCLNLM